MLVMNNAIYGKNSQHTKNRGNSLGMTNGIYIQLMPRLIPIVKHWEHFLIEQQLNSVKTCQQLLLGSCEKQKGTKGIQSTKVDCSSCLEVELMNYCSFYIFTSIGITIFHPCYATFSRIVCLTAHFLVFWHMSLKAP